MPARASAAAPAHARDFEMIPRREGGPQWLARVGARLVPAFMHREIEVRGAQVRHPHTVPPSSEPP
jgi:hypothetical protein